MTMESTQLTKNYYNMICSNGVVNDEGEIEMLEAIEREPQPMTLCAECRYLSQCSEPIELPCPMNGYTPKKE